MLSNYALKLMEKSLYGDRLREDLDIARGTKSITDLPSFAPAAQGIRDQGALALQDVAKSLLESGTSGPAAGLAMEKVGTGIDNAVLKLPQQLLASREGDPWKAYDNTLKRRQQNMNYSLAQQQQDAQPSSFMQMLPLIMKGIGMAAAPFTGGASLGLTGLAGMFGGGGANAGTGAANALSGINPQWGQYDLSGWTPWT